MNIFCYLLMICIILIFFIRYINKSKKLNRINLPFNEILKIAKTGDLIFTNYYMSPAPPIFNSEWAHVGMIYKRDTKVYLFESETYLPWVKGITGSGVYINDLEKRLKNVDGYSVLVPLKKELTEDRKKILDILIDKYYGIKYNIPIFIKIFIGCKHPFKDIWYIKNFSDRLYSGTLQCSELMAKVLTALELDEFTDRGYCTHPEHIWRESKKSLDYNGEIEFRS